jgi:hypothetical protein
VRKLLVATVTLLAIGGLVVWTHKIQGPEVIAEQSLCDGAVKVQSTKYLAGEGGYSYSVHVFYSENAQVKEVFLISDVMPSRFGSDSYIPLPIDTTIPTIQIENSSDFSDGPPPLLNVFIDPSVVSRKEFNIIGDCLKANTQVINTMLAETPNVNGQAFGRYPPRFGGLAYISPNDFYSLIRSVNTDSPPNGESGDYKMVNDVGAVISGSSYIGDIFNGVTSQREGNTPLRAGSYISKNSKGEDIYQYVARLQKEIRKTPPRAGESASIIQNAKSTVEREFPAEI